MKETLGDKQRRFTKLIGMLIQHAYAQGYELTVGDAYRDPRVHGDTKHKLSYSARNSNHKRRLAMDFNLFKDGKYLTKTEDYQPLGEYWISLADDCEWGGEDGRHDGNHFSLNFNGQW